MILIAGGVSLLLFMFQAHFWQCNQIGKKYKSEGDFLVFIEYIYCLATFNKRSLVFSCFPLVPLSLEISKETLFSSIFIRYFFLLFLSETGSWGFWPHLHLSQCQEVVCSKRFHDTDLFLIYQIARSINRSLLFFPQL